VQAPQNTENNLQNIFKHTSDVVKDISVANAVSFNGQLAQVIQQPSSNLLILPGTIGEGLQNNEVAKKYFNDLNAMWQTKRIK
jgi:hypothetical protein